MHTQGSRLSRWHLFPRLIPDSSVYVSHNSPVLWVFFGAIKLPATSSFPCPRLSLSLRPGSPTALWETGCPPPAGRQGPRPEDSLRMALEMQTSGPQALLTLTPLSLSSQSCPFWPHQGPGGSSKGLWPWATPTSPGSLFLNPIPCFLPHVLLWAVSEASESSERGWGLGLGVPCPRVPHQTPPSHPHSHSLESGLITSCKEVRDHLQAGFPGSQPQPRVVCHKSCSAHSPMIQPSVAPQYFHLPEFPFSMWCSGLSIPSALQTVSSCCPALQSEIRPQLSPTGTVPASSQFTPPGCPFPTLQVHMQGSRGP